MTRRFILSASIGDPALADPALADPSRAAQWLVQAEAVGVDMLLLGQPDSLPFDPQVIAAWAAPRLSRMGVVPLVSTRIAHPFHTARALSAIDHLASGMLGWCPVAEDGDTDRLADFVRATTALWDGWDEDCLIIDKESGRYLDTTKVRPSNYHGTHYNIRGPVNAMRPRQGHPVLVSTSASPLALQGVDVAIGQDARQAPHAARHLLRIGNVADAQGIAQRFSAGEIDGVHLDLHNPQTELPVLAEHFSVLIRNRPTTGTLRERLGLPPVASASTMIPAPSQKEIV